MNILFLEGVFVILFSKMPACIGRKVIIGVNRLIIAMNSMFALMAMMLLSLISILPIANAQEKAKGFTGGVSYSTASGDNNYSSTAINYSLGFDKAWGGEFFKTRFSTLFSGANYDFAITQTAKQENYDKIESFNDIGIIVTANAPRRASRLYETSKQVHDIDQSLLEIKAGNHFKFVAGRIKNDWGVFNNDNPSLSLFPRRQVAAHEFLSNDRDAILAQDQIQFHFTTGIFTFQYYKFAPARTDEDFEQEQREKLVLGTYSTQIKETETTTGDFGREVVTPIAPVLGDLRDIKFRAENSKAPRFSAGIPHDDPEPPNDLKYDSPYTTDAQAFRIALKPFWGQFAFTHHQGRDMSRPLLFSSFRNLLDISTDTDTNFETVTDLDFVFTNIPAFSPAIHDNPNLGQSVLKDANYIFYPETIMDSFEIEVPFGKKILWRFASARFETIEGLGDNGRMFLNVDDLALTSESISLRIPPIFDRISNPNRDDEVRGSILYLAVKRTTAMGIDYRGERYQGELNFIHSSAPAPINETEAEIIRLIQYFEQRVDENTYRIRSNFDSQTFITGKFTRKFGAEKQHEGGIVFDHILGRKGQGGFYTHNFKNNIALSLFAGTVTLEDIGTGEAYVNGETDKDTAILQTNIAWKF